MLWIPARDTTWVAACPSHQGWWFKWRGCQSIPIQPWQTPSAKKIQKEESWGWLKTDEKLPWFGVHSPHSLGYHLGSVWFWLIASWWCWTHQACLDGGMARLLRHHSGWFLHPWLSYDISWLMMEIRGNPISSGWFRGTPLYERYLHFGIALKARIPVTSQGGR